MLKYLNYFLLDILIKWTASPWLEPPGICFLAGTFYGTYLNTPLLGKPLYLGLRSKGISWKIPLRSALQCLLLSVHYATPKVLHGLC